MTLRDTILFCAGNKNLVAQFDRLNGSNLSLKGSPLDIGIDKATGRTNKDMAEFCGFVEKYIFSPVYGDR